MYFKGHRLNNKDRILMDLPKAEREKLIVDFTTQYFWQILLSIFVVVSSIILLFGFLTTRVGGAIFIIFSIIPFLGLIGSIAYPFVAYRRFEHMRKVLSSNDDINKKK